MYHRNVERFQWILIFMKPAMAMQRACIRQTQFITECVHTATASDDSYIPLIIYHSRTTLMNHRSLQQCVCRGTSHQTETHQTETQQTENFLYKTIQKIFKIESKLCLTLPLTLALTGVKNKSNNNLTKITKKSTYCLKYIVKPFGNPIPIHLKTPF